MSIDVVRASAADRADVLAFLTGHPWPFHVEAEPAPAEVADRLDRGWLQAAGTETFWIRGGTGRCGLLRIFDLDDGTPLFDLRLAPAARGLGTGTLAVRWLTGHVFDSYPDIDRIEATTRADNVAMRGALRAAGWVKESHWRQAWPDGAGRRHDAVGYGVLRADHTGARVTAVHWDDEPQPRGRQPH